MEESPSRVSSGEERQVAFCREMSAKLVRLAARAGLLPARAADMVQSLWLRFCKNFPDFAEVSAHQYYRAWLLTAARHRISDAVRAQRRVRTCSLDALNKEPKDQREQSSANRASDNAHSFLLRCWLEGLRQSDPRTYELIWERHVEGHSLAELVQRTGRDARWISRRINRGLNKFRIWLLTHRDDGAATA